MLVFARALTKCILNRKTFIPNSSETRHIKINCLELYKGFFPIPSTSQNVEFEKRKS